MERIPYFSGLCAYWLGRRHDSISASSSGVADRSEKPRSLLRVRFRQDRLRVMSPPNASVPSTAPTMMILVC